MADISADALSSIGLTSYGSKSSGDSSSGQANGSGTLAQTDFLKLMVAQLNHQDPMKPMDNGEFLGQMAQFSTVTGIEELTKAFGTLSQSLGQGLTLQAAGLVGKQVMVPGDTATLAAGDTVNGAVDLDATAGAVRVEVTDGAGQVIRTIELGQLSSGLHEFAWDGLKSDGSVAPAGTYNFKVTAQMNGATEALSPMLSGEVKSVSLDSNSGGVKLSVKGIGDVDVADVYRIG